MLSVGLKGIDSGGTENVEALILETLGALADKGLDRMTVEASLNTVEFRLRENTSALSRVDRGAAALAQNLALRSRPAGAAGVRGAAARTQNPHR